jgi:hypothetical protein
MSLSQIILLLKVSQSVSSSWSRVPNCYSWSYFSLEEHFGIVSRGASTILGTKSMEQSSSNQSRNSPHFTDSEVSLLCSQEPANLIETLKKLQDCHGKYEDHICLCEI